MIFGLKAEASNNRTLFSVSYVLDSVDKSKLEATITGGTKWCPRCLLQDIIIVSAVSLYFFLFWYIIHFRYVRSSIEICSFTNLLNPHIWAHSSYEVQTELYLFLIQYFETDGKLLPILCGLPKIIGIVCLLSLYYICREATYRRNSQDPFSPIESCRNEPKVS